MLIRKLYQPKERHIPLYDIEHLNELCAFDSESGVNYHRSEVGTINEGQTIELDNVVVKVTDELYTVAITCYLAGEPVGYFDFRVKEYFQHRTALGGGHFYQRNYHVIAEGAGVQIEASRIPRSIRSYVAMGSNFSPHNSLAVSTKYRSKGLGKLLLFQALQIAQILEADIFKVKDSTTPPGKDVRQGYYGQFLKIAVTAAYMNTVWFPLHPYAAEQLKGQMEPKLPPSQES